MIPLLLAIRIGSEGRKGFPLFVPLILVYAVLLILVVPALAVFLLMFLVGRGGKARMLSGILFGFLKLITAARGLSLYIENDDDRVRFFII